MIVRFNRLSSLESRYMLDGESSQGYRAVMTMLNKARIHTVEPLCQRSLEATPPF